MGHPGFYTFFKRVHFLPDLTLTELLNLFIAPLPFHLDRNRARAHRLREVIAADSSEGFWVKRFEFS